jgi:hypothetical protein
MLLLDILTAFCQSVVGLWHVQVLYSYLKAAHAVHGYFPLDTPAQFLCNNQAVTDLTAMAGIGSERQVFAARYGDQDVVVKVSSQQQVQREVRLRCAARVGWLPLSYNLN